MSSSLSFVRLPLYFCCSSFIWGAYICMRRMEEYCLITSGSRMIRTSTVRTTMDHP